MKKSQETSAIEEDDEEPSNSEPPSEGQFLVPKSTTITTTTTSHTIISKTSQPNHLPSSPPSTIISHTEKTTRILSPSHALTSSRRRTMSRSSRSSISHLTPDLLNSIVDNTPLLDKPSNDSEQVSSSSSPTRNNNTPKVNRLRKAFVPLARPSRPSLTPSTGNTKPDSSPKISSSPVQTQSGLSSPVESTPSSTYSSSNRILRSPFTPGGTQDTVASSYDDSSQPQQQTKTSTRVLNKLRHLTNRETTVQVRKVSSQEPSQLPELPHEVEPSTEKETTSISAEASDVESDKEQEPDQDKEIPSPQDESVLLPQKRRQQEKDDDEEEEENEGDVSKRRRESMEKGLEVYQEEDSIRSLKAYHKDPIEKELENSKSSDSSDSSDNSDSSDDSVPVSKRKAKTRTREEEEEEDDDEEEESSSDDDDDEVYFARQPTYSELRRSSRLAARPISFTPLYSTHRKTNRKSKSSATNSDNSEDEIEASLENFEREIRGENSDNETSTTTTTTTKAARRELSKAPPRPISKTSKRPSKKGKEKSKKKRANKSSSVATTTTSDPSQKPKSTKKRGVPGASLLKNIGSCDIVEYRTRPTLETPLILKIKDNGEYDENGKIVIAPSDLPRYGTGFRPFQIENAESVSIDTDKFTMADISSREFHVGEADEDYAVYEAVKLERRRARERAYIAKKKARQEGLTLREIERIKASILKDTTNGEDETPNEVDIDELIPNQQPKAAAPRLTMVDGKFVVASTEVDRHQAAQTQFNGPDGDTRVREEVDSIREYYNSQSFAKHKKGESWAKHETDLFYESLSTWGTDFSIIAGIFPGRTRRQIRNKFKYEERKNPTKLELALVRKLPTNLSSYGQISGKSILSVEEVKKELENIDTEYRERIAADEQKRQRNLAEDNERAMRADVAEFGIAAQATGGFSVGGFGSNSNNSGKVIRQTLNKSKSSFKRELRMNEEVVGTVGGD